MLKDMFKIIILLLYSIAFFLLGLLSFICGHSSNFLQIIAVLSLIAGSVFLAAAVVYGYKKLTRNPLSFHL